ncbi:hypothetical protein ACROYT_G039110 [Oculina patagonica]
MTYFFTANSKYAPSVTYQRLFLKHILKLCEENGSEISDELYEAYGDVFGKVEDLNAKCFKTYIVPCGALLTLKETQQYISKGTTGLSTWMAGEYLAEWALENTSTFKDRNIIELGCGVGLTGLVICSTSSPCQYIFSDYHEEVLEALHCNLGLNGFTPNFEPSQMEETSLSCTVRKNNIDSEKSMDKHLEEKPVAMSIHLTNDNQNHTNSSKIPVALHQRSELTNDKTKVKESDLQKCDGILGCKACGSDFLESDGTCNQSSRAVNFIAYFSRQSSNIWRHLADDCGKHSERAQVDVCKLEWQNLRKSDLEKFPVGIILAADVIYDVDLIPSLVRTLHLLLSTHGDRQGIKPVAYIASTIRNPLTYELFLNKLNEHNISWSEVTKPMNQVFYYDRSCEIKIIKLQV